MQLFPLKTIPGWRLLFAVALLLAGTGPARAQDADSGDSLPTSLTPNAEPEPSEEPLRPAFTDINYRIAPADILSIAVFQEDDLKSLVRVSNEGDITFPLIGVVDVKGLSTTQAARAIAARLSRGYLINPQVTVTVMEFAKHRFTVLGQVQKPGAYAIPDQQDVTLLQAIGMAGGYTNIADPRKVTLMRKVGDRQKVYRFNARKMADGDAEAAFNVLPGDVITVGESFF